MPRICTVCASEKRADIEQQIAAGRPGRAIASQHNVGRMAIARHVQDGHVAESIKASQVAQDEVRALDVARELDWANKQIHVIHDLAMKGKKPDLRVALSAVNASTRHTELCAELQGELDRSTHIDLRQSPDWLNMREIIFKALEPFPEAKVVVARALYEEAKRGRDVA